MRNTDADDSGSLLALTVVRADGIAATHHSACAANLFATVLARELHGHCGALVDASGGFADLVSQIASSTTGRTQGVRE